MCDVPGLGELVVLERPGESIKYDPAYTWPSGGGEKRPGGIARKTGAHLETAVWDGRPDSSLLTSEPVLRRKSVG